MGILTDDEEAPRETTQEEYDRKQSELQEARDEHNRRRKSDDSE